MTAPIRVSAIVPTFNRCEFIEETLDAILGQSRAPDEVLVVDDGSTDDTAAVVARYAGRVGYLRQDNAGKAAALNRGLAATRGDAIWVCDDDDVPLQGALARFCAALEKDEQADFVFGLHDELVEQGAGWVVRPAPALRRFQEPLSIQVLRGCFIFQPGMLVRRRCYERVGGFDEALFRSQDYDMLIRLAHDCRGVELYGPVFHQRAHAGVRGPAHERTGVAKRRTQWLRYDRLIFTKVRDLYQPDEFGRGRAGAIRRATIMARRGLWSDAAADLHRGAGDPRPLGQEERRDLSTVFDWAGYALLAVRESRPFFDALARWPAGPARQAGRALVQPLGRRLRVALRRLDLEELGRLVRAGSRIAAAVARATRTG